MNETSSFLQLSMRGKGGGYPSGRRAQGAQGGQARSNVTGVRISCKQDLDLLPIFQSLM